MTTSSPAPPLAAAPTPGPMLASWAISRIRSAVPLVVGLAITFAEHQWGWWPRNLDGQAITPGVVFAVSYGYYELVRQLERWKPQLGWLLGYPAQPHYGG